MRVGRANPGDLGMEMEVPRPPTYLKLWLNNISKWDLGNFAVGELTIFSLRNWLVIGVLVNRPTGYKLYSDIGP